MAFEAHSIRLFPKNGGADAYQTTGIAARCDWVVHTDNAHPRFHVFRNVNSPNTVFLSMRAPFVAIEGFASKVLPQIKSDFVLVSGSEDATIPRQVDRRWRPFSQNEQDLIRQIHDHPRLVKWYVENLDATLHPKMRPLPTGLVFPSSGSHKVRVPAVPPLRQRPLAALCAHRVRSGEQWGLRRRVSELARTHWSAHCTVIDAEIPEPEFLRMVEAHSFVLCVAGGGHDPSPKAWQAILHGAIPIIARSPVSAAYEALPCLIVDDWSSGSLNANILSAAKADLIDRFERPALRAEVIDRLSLDYWWRQILAGYGRAHNC